MQEAHGIVEFLYLVDMSERPVCDYCHNKVSDNEFIWIESEKKLVHKVCKIINDELRKDVVVTPSPLKMGTNMKGW